MVVNWFIFNEGNSKSCGYRTFIALKGHFEKIVLLATKLQITFCEGIFLAICSFREERDTGSAVCD